MTDTETEGEQGEEEVEEEHWAEKEEAGEEKWEEGDGSEWWGSEIISAQTYCVQITQHQQ